MGEDKPHHSCAHGLRPNRGERGWHHGGVDSEFMPVLTSHSPHQACGGYVEDWAFGLSGQQRGAHGTAQSKTDNRQES
jgi:hypothetical protein